uniref:Thioredoxin domain-containing protein n=1 Tax=Chromera velia CCMP2878 TaxID=1169474 RepID=A0A0G4HXC2_9ALVE|eukprot:Cvel_9222.t2-p1 / transcript=Cvel_9222.t2 / gene=Cvel_9222 / organism=Chromera_velia_CCMP2878 / gene_product=Protein disulfide isomerase-like 1-4, putative / transcript_product=Protein disulfide isomerase-like 1-4, putative / location=Cvel_scaffold526:3738-11242(-) / protein_length=453 / sequence_SO=supercontig / SO=protein_coding / is_pseudo=false
MAALPIVSFLQNELADCTKEEQVGREGIGLKSFEALETTVGAEEHVLVLFYAPWCFWSRQLLPEFQEAAQRLRHHDPPVHLVKIDASADSHAQDKYEISEFPTLRFFVDGIGHEYQGGRTAAKIIQWVNAYLDREIEIKTPEQAEDFVHHRVASALAIFSPSSSSKKGTGEASELTEMGGETEGLFKKAFKHSAQRHSEMHFGITESASVIEYIRSTRGLKELKAPSLVVFKPHDEGREVAVWNEPVKALADYKSIDKFVLSHKLPRVVSLTPDTAENIFEDGRPVLAVFEKEKDRDPQIEAELKAVADSFPSEILVILGGSSHQHEKRLIGMLGGDPDDEEKFPLVRLFTKNAAGSSHFHPTLKFDFKGPLRRSPLGKFVSDFLGDKLQPFYMSEDAPEDHTQGGLTTVVGSTFSSLVRDPSKDAIVEFFAPWCGHCRKLEPVWREVSALNE